MEDDGFKVVRSRKGKSKLKKYGHEGAQRIAGSIDDIRLALEKADAQMRESGLSMWLMAQLDDIVGNRRISEVYLLGNGHFDAAWEPGTHQLVLVKEICDHCQAEVVFQEPCLSSDERLWLSEQANVVIRDKTDVLCMGHRKGSADCVQLVVIIHGLHGLLNDFLKTNWQPRRLQNIVIICNDYRNVDLIKAQSEEKSDFDAISAYCKFATFIDLPEYTPHPFFFLNTSVAYFQGLKLPEL